MAGLLGLDDDMRLALLTAGLGTLAGRGGPMRAAGQGGLLGVQSYQNSKQEKLDAKKIAMQEQLWQSQIAENQAQAEERRAKLKQAQDDAARRARLDEGAPRIGPTWNAPQPGASPQVAEAFGVPAAKPQKTGFDQFQSMVDRANYYANAGDMEKATKYYDAAEKFRKKYSPDLRTVVKDGKLVVVQSSDTGDVLTHEGMEPKPENQIVDRGGSQDVIDLLRTKPGTSYAKTPTISDRIAQGNAGLARERFEWEKKEKAAGAGGDGAPKWDSSSGTFIYPPSPTATTGRSVRPEGYPEKSGKNAEGAKQIPGIVAEAMAILDSGDPTSGALEWAGSGAAGLFGQSTKGAEATAKLKVLSAKLMFAQPRFEGPQGVLDVKLYEQAAGDLANPLKPISVRKAALQTLLDMHNKYGSPAIRGAGLTPAPAGSGVDFVYTPGSK